MVSFKYAGVVLRNYAQRLAMWRCRMRSANKCSEAKCLARLNASFQHHQNVLLKLIHSAYTYPAMAHRCCCGHVTFIPQPQSNRSCLIHSVDNQIACTSYFFSKCPNYYSRPLHSQRQKCLKCCPYHC